MAILTCHTVDCASAGESVDYCLAQVDMYTGEACTVTTVACGACSQPITDITDVT